MRSLSIILVLVGLALETAALVAWIHPEHPLVGRLSAPRLVQAGEAVDLLVSGQSVPPDHLGFDALAATFRDELSRQNPNLPIHTVSIVTIQPSEEPGAVLFELSNGQSLRWNLPGLESTLEKQRSEKLSRHVFLVAALGALLLLAAALVYLRGKPAEPSTD